MNGTPSLRDAAEHAKRVALGQESPIAPPAPAPVIAASGIVPLGVPTTIAAPALAPPTPYAWEPPPGFDPVPQDFLLYHPDFCDGRAIFGILVDAIPLLFQRGPGTEGTVVPAVWGLIVQLMEDTLALDPSASRRVIVARPGQEIMVGADHVALRRLVRAALDPQSVGEVWLRPDPQVRLLYGADHHQAWITRHGKNFARKSIKRSAA